MATPEEGAEARTPLAPVVGKWAAIAALIGIGLLVVRHEARTSNLQSVNLSERAERLTYRLQPGPSDRIRFPGPGPYDIRFGYHELPERIAGLSENGFVVAGQAQISEAMAATIDGGLFPIFREKTQAGLTLVDHQGASLFEARIPEHAFRTFDEIPEPVVSTLLFIESRGFLDERLPLRNPAIEWDRMLGALLELGLRAVGMDRNVPGASTIATQLEKFRHSPSGLTSGPREKLKQMASASLRAYLDGEETIGARRRIVLDYLNSVPMAAIPGYGEVTGLGDGLWAWYGADLVASQELLYAIDPTTAPTVEAAAAYRRILSLLLAHRRPSYYLATEKGRADLTILTDVYLNLLEEAGTVPTALLHAARAQTITVRGRAPERPAASFVQRKAVNQIRGSLLGLLGVERLYELDRLDLEVRTTIDGPLQDSVTALFGRLGDPDFVRASGLNQFRLLDRGDPGRVIYSFTLLERTPSGNLVRAITDNFDAPFNLNESARIELGSTAKLRTLVTYLEIVAQLHSERVSPEGQVLASVPSAPVDRLTTWIDDYLRSHPGASLEETLAAAMNRRYSGSPRERFATGGGVQTFANFDSRFDGQSLTVVEAFRHSVNLPFVRIMKDIVDFHIRRLPSGSARALDSADDPARADILTRFADREGSAFLRSFFRKYDGVEPDQILDRLVDGRRLTPLRMAWVYRTVQPEASLEDFSDFLRLHQPDADIDDAGVANLFRRTDPRPHTLSDLGYLANVHPLELWVARWRMANPLGTSAEAVVAGADARQEVYRWLFRTHRRNAQDNRIRIMLELEAFESIQKSWSRLGYPFQNLVPSLGTAIGSSGDRPSSLAELVGIVLNGGVRRPSRYVEELHFASDTPYETLLTRAPVPEMHVLAPEVAQVVRLALIDVVQEGSAVRMRNGIRHSDGTTAVVGGKTGTGDNRFRTFSPGGVETASTSMNRTSAFAFFVGDRYFGVITAYVPGPEAAEYRFTSSLPLAVLRLMGPWIAALDDVSHEPAEPGLGAREGLCPQANDRLCNTD